MKIPIKGKEETKLVLSTMLNHDLFRCMLHEFNQTGFTSIIAKAAPHWFFSLDLQTNDE